MWSRKFANCVTCHKTDAKHMAHGLCHRCYLQQYQRQNRMTLRQYKHNWYMRNHAVMLLRNRQAREQRWFAGQRDAVLARDKHTCQQCGATTQLVVHHIDNTGRNCAQPNNELRNLTTLCRSCHVGVHRKQINAARRRSRVPKLGKSGRWSRAFEACVECHKQTSKHAARGLCTACYQRTR
jgi:5-methylcytosine-specific restriction endonuclease McrA